MSDAVTGRGGVLLLALAAIIGCSETRRSWTTAELLAVRHEEAERLPDEAAEFLGGAIACVRSQYDEYKAGRRTEPPTFEFLIISGGGDWGAFGSGFLRGWGRLSGPMARPSFTVVTGVSTGSLIAPFAFLGDDSSIELVERLYRDPKPDWVVKRLPLWFLPNNASFATVPGLEREVRKYMDFGRIARIVEEGKKGRMLVMNTTNIDDGSMHVWNMIRESKRAIRTGDLDRVHRIMLASSGIPGAFPFRIIDGVMHVDGGVTGNIIYGGRLREKQTHLALWKAMYPDLPLPRTRFWVIFNNQFRGPPQEVEPNWPAVVMRSVDLAIRSATLTAIRHLIAQAKLSQLAFGADVEVRVVAVPDDWKAPKKGTFVKETMNALADMGERMGEDPASWATDLPQ